MNANDKDTFSTGAVMATQSPQFPGDGTGGFKSKSPKVFLNYFGKDRWIHALLAEKRTRLVSVVVPPLNRLGLVPDTISYVGIAFLAGVVLYFVRHPVIAVLFLAGHVICDGVDGAYARHTGKPSQSGAFTDLACDQLGMVVVAMMAILHHMVSPVLGAVYIALYLIVVVFGVLINVLGIGSRITITSKYILYIVFAIWAGWGENYFPLLMYFFSGIMSVEVVIGYLRLKRGIRRKFDTEVRFTEGDPYSGRLNYALNVAVPITVLAVILVGANLVPLRATFDSPKLMVKWNKGANILGSNGSTKALCFGIRDGALLVLVRLPDDTLELRRITPGRTSAHESFVVPSYICPAFSTLPVDGNVVLIADRSTRLLMGIDLEASFARNYAVTVMNLPVRYLSVTAAAVATWKGTRVWLAANYLYTRKTYVVDPNQALRQGYILGGEVASYTNGAFPSGMTVHGDTVFDFNKSPLEALIYKTSLKKLVAGKNLLDAAKVSFLPPDRDALGPVSEGDKLFMLSPNGQVYWLPIHSLPGTEAPSK
jgi:phosphatidylglycerophosphate synthase